MGKRFYIGKKEPEAFLENLDEWLADKIPLAPPGTACECDKERHEHAAGTVETALDVFVNVDCPLTADSYSYRVEGDHVCYTWLCTPCVEATTSDDYLGDVEFPVTAGGYAVSPRHCA